VGDWLLNLPVPLMALIVFAATYLVAAGVFLIVTGLAVGDRAKAFKAVSPGMLPPLGIIFGLLVGFIAVQVWGDFEKAKIAVATEAGALRTVVLFADAFPEEQKTQIDALINRHIEEAVTKDWPAMAAGKAKLSTLPAALTEELHDTLAIAPANDSERTALSQMMTALHTALDARRQRIVVSQSSVGRVKWTGILLQALCTLIAIAMVHSDNKLACGIALALFSTGIALSVLLIAAYSRPFTGQISVGPDLLKQVIAGEAKPGTSP
jgi:hypothetical protein